MINRYLKLTDAQYDIFSLRQNIFRRQRQKKFAHSQTFPYLCNALLQQNNLLNNKLCINEIEISINDIL